MVLQENTVVVLANTYTASLHQKAPDGNNKVIDAIVVLSL